MATDSDTRFEGDPLRDPDAPLFPQTPTPPVTWPDRIHYVKWVKGVTIRPDDGKVFPNYVIFFRTWCPRCGRRLDAAASWILRTDMSGHKAFHCHPDRYDETPE